MSLREHLATLHCELSNAQHHIDKAKSAYNAAVSELEKPVSSEAVVTFANQTMAACDNLLKELGGD